MVGEERRGDASEGDWLICANGDVGWVGESG